MQNHIDEALPTRVEQLLEGERTHEALKLLNATTEHRFTGVYQVDDEVLRNVALFDRTNPDLPVGKDAPLLETYCAITAAKGAPFCTTDAASDQRVEGHPARDATRSYCGVPLRLEDGEPFGTLCHFDAVPRPADEDDIRLLARVAPLFARHLRSSDGGAEGDEAAVHPPEVS